MTDTTSTITDAGAAPNVALAAASPVRPVYSGQRNALFRLAFTRMLLTIATFGIGRFWMITRLRQYYWSSISIAGAPLEYTGRAMEKLIGFLIAVVVLAAYLLVVNLGLLFLGLSVFQGNLAALQLPLIAVIPLIFWAQYKALRYLLARTRWRGIRFGLEPGAWGFMFRALGWGTLTTLTLGFLYPLMQIRLSRYVTNRSLYGDLHFEQTGTWGPLLKSWLWVWWIVPLMIGFIVAGATGVVDIFVLRMVMESEILGPIALILFYLVFGFNVLRHHIFSFRYLWSCKHLDGQPFVTVELGVWRVIGIYVGGFLLIGAVMVGMFVILLLGGAAIWAMMNGPSFESMMIDPALIPIGATFFTVLFVIVLGYFLALAVAVALSHAFLHHPMLRAMAEGAVFPHPEVAARAHQRPHDATTEAGGFADALGADVGAAFG